MLDAGCWVGAEHRMGSLLSGSSVQEAMSGDSQTRAQDNGHQWEQLGLFRDWEFLLKDELTFTISYIDHSC